MKNYSFLLWQIVIMLSLLISIFDKRTKMKSLKPVKTLLLVFKQKT